MKTINEDYEKNTYKNLVRDLVAIVGMGLPTNHHLRELLPSREPKSYSYDFLS